MPQFMLLECIHVKLLQPYLTLWNPMDCSLPDFYVHGILQARTLGWVAMPSSRGSSPPRDWTCISYVYLHWQAGSLPLVPPGNDSGFDFLVSFNPILIEEIFHLPKVNVSISALDSILLLDFILPVAFCLISLPLTLIQWIFISRLLCIRPGDTIVSSPQGLRTLKFFERMV